jgi:hypothetical protein
VVSELAADLEDLYGAYRAEGLPVREARRRAERMLAPSPEVLAALSRMHRPIWVRLGDRFSEKGQHRVEWAMLVALTTGFCAGSVITLVRASMTPAPVPFAVAILIVAFASLLYAAGSGLAQYLGRWPGSEGARVDVTVLVVAAVAALVLSGLGALVGLWRVAAAITANPAIEVQEVLRWVRGASGLGALGLVVALADGLALLVLRRTESELVDEARRWSGSLAVESASPAQVLTKTG